MPGHRLTAFATVFTAIFAVVYALAVWKNYALFTYHPELHEFGLWVQKPRTGPAMYWYGWIATAAISACVSGIVASVALPRLTRWLWPGSWVAPLGAMAALAYLLRNYFLA